MLLAGPFLILLGLLLLGAIALGKRIHFRTPARQTTFNVAAIVSAVIIVVCLFFVVLTAALNNMS